jgi:hypothetical protein
MAEKKYSIENKDTHLIGRFRDSDGNFTYSSTGDDFFELKADQISYSSYHFCSDVIKKIPNDDFLVGVVYGSRSDTTVDIQFMVTGNSHIILTNEITGRKHPFDSKILKDFNKYMNSNITDTFEDINDAREREIKEEISNNYESIGVKQKQADPQMKGPTSIKNPPKVGSYLVLKRDDVHRFLENVGDCLDKTDSSIFAVCVVKVSIVKFTIEKIIQHRINCERTGRKVIPDKDMKERSINCWNLLNINNRVKKILDKQIESKEKVDRTNKLILCEILNIPSSHCETLINKSESKAEPKEERKFVDSARAGAGGYSDFGRRDGAGGYSDFGRRDGAGVGSGARACSRDSARAGGYSGAGSRDSARAGGYSGAGSRDNDIDDGYSEVVRRPRNFRKQNSPKRKQSVSNKKIDSLYTLKELQKFAKRGGLIGYYKLRKNELITVLKKVYEF